MPVDGHSWLVLS